MLVAENYRQGSMSNLISQLEEIIEPITKSLGFELWGIEFSAHKKNALLRIYIDSEQGVNVEDCAQVSRQVSSVLDVEDPITSKYILEVSSPGLDRKLFKPKHFASYAGHQAEVKLHIPYEGQRNFTGVLKGVEEDEVVLQIEDEEFCFPLETIDKAKLKVVFERGLK